MKQLREGCAPGASTRRQPIFKRNRSLQLLSARMLAAEKAERRRGTLELPTLEPNKEFAPTPSAAEIKTGALSKAAAKHQFPTKTGSGGEIITLVRHVSRDLRALAMDPRPSALDELGLIVAIRDLCRQAGDIDRRFKFIPMLSVCEEELPDPLRGVVFRVLQQTVGQLMNAQGIGDVKVVLRREWELRLRIEFEAKDPNDPTVSLAGQRIPDIWKRAVLAGGSFSSVRTTQGRFLYQAAWVV